MIVCERQVDSVLGGRARPAAHRKANAAARTESTRPRLVPIVLTRELVKHGMVRRDTLIARARGTNLSSSLHKLVKSRIERDFKARAR